MGHGQPEVDEPEVVAPRSIPVPEACEEGGDGREGEGVVGQLGFAAEAEGAPEASRPLTDQEDQVAVDLLVLLL